MSYTVIPGDCIQGMRTLPDESIHCCITSPPYYGLRDYGTARWEGGNAECDHVHCTNAHGGQRKDRTQDGYKKQYADICGKCGAVRVDDQIGLEETPTAYVAKMAEVFREVRRVLRKDGTLWLNLGDTYAANRGGSPMPAETLAGGVSGRGDKVAKRGRESDFLPHRNPASHGLKHKDLIGIPWRVAFALQADGWWLRQDIIWHKPNPMPESVTDRCTKAHEYIFLLAKSQTYYYDHEAVKEALKPCSIKRNQSGWNGNEDRGYVNGPQNHMSKYLGSEKAKQATHRNRRSVWTVTPKPYKGAHFATFPPDLIEPCVLAGCPVGGTILDPFGGSGTTAQVAVTHGRNAVLCELNPAYIELIHRRLANVTPLLIGGGK